MQVDAIVNAAKPSLLGGGGVDGAIHRAAGPELLEECRTLGGCEVGQARITRAYRLPCRYVIHTVGPKWHGGLFGEQSKLASCYRSALTLAKEYNCESVAFPLISAGTYGYPKEKAIQVALDAIGAFLLENDMTVYLVVYGQESLDIGHKLFAEIQEYIDDHYVAEHVPQFHARRAERESLGESFSLPESREYEAAAKPGSQGEPSPAGAAGRGEAPEPFLAPSPREAACEEDKSGLPHRDTAPAPHRPELPCAAQDLDDTADLSHLFDDLDESFQQMLLRKIDESGMTDAQCYKKANIDRKLFSKIRKDVFYKPSKTTAIAFAVALEMNLGETESLLRKAGFALSRSSKFDVIVQYFIEHRKYNIFEINEVLFHYDQALLGS